MEMSKYLKNNTSFLVQAPPQTITRRVGNTLKERRSPEPLLPPSSALLLLSISVFSFYPCFSAEAELSRNPLWFQIRWFQWQIRTVYGVVMRLEDGFFLVVSVSRACLEISYQRNFPLGSSSLAVCESSSNLHRVRLRCSGGVGSCGPWISGFFRSSSSSSGVYRGSAFGLVQGWLLACLVADSCGGACWGCGLLLCRVHLGV
ncbi:hypothetical protein F2Q70_00013653 [Brassica cretica]|uniref:Uncharacterized protein n=1 Tax=Brassica cretica TaxID=69181 RepID=A0A8S9M4M5_BRACR|nr:hypothetical protein F2Q70_00013653 [Brassica cretica]